MQIYVAVVSRHVVPGYNKSPKVGMSVTCSFIRKKDSCIEVSGRGVNDEARGQDCQRCFRLWYPEFGFYSKCEKCQWIT